ncbi:MAG: RAMP superfamily CRISPR-associated protein [Rivularia sp. (in: cyanobacteria)]|mgnify:CR=1 FL=1
MSDSDLVPLMYRAQIEDRGKIQYAGDNRRRDEEKSADKWLNQWLKGCPPVPKTLDENIPKWKQRQPQTLVKMPQFGANVHTWEYTQNWRLVTNSGQDEGVIRPVIGAKGIPFYPGTSMKGAFLRACQQIAADKVVDYCGGEVEEIVAGKKQKRIKPGVLRFHGGYPVDMSWGNTKRLLDIVHNQEERQVMDNVSTRANVQISLYKTKFKFGISRTKTNSDIKVDWEQVREIWERALSEGIGSRTSAGYGRFVEIEDNNKVVLSVNLNGKGLTPKLLNGIPELRPNMFKAALRGHTLRLLAGVTDEATTQRLTKELWGGFLRGNQGNGSVVGKFGIDFDAEDLEIKDYGYSSIYNLKSGKLNILSVKSVSEQESEFVEVLIKFSLLLGGFGKSWRRVHHGLFYNSYFDNNDKPMIGCHWFFSKLSKSRKYCITAPNGELTNIINFLSSIPDTVRSCFDLPSTNTFVNNWREVWHPQRVQVWGRIAENKKDSQAVGWFHDKDIGRLNIKRTKLTGKIGNRNNPSQVSRIWHRMYPLYITKNGKMMHKKNKVGEFKYVELLTIFTPDRLLLAREFLSFLDSNSNDFIRLWGGN